MRVIRCLDRPRVLLLTALPASGGAISRLTKYIKLFRRKATPPPSYQHFSFCLEEHVSVVFCQNFLGGGGRPVAAFGPCGTWVAFAAMNIAACAGAKPYASRNAVNTVL